MSGSSRVWMLAAALAVAAGVGLALMRKPDSVSVPLPAPSAEAPPSSPAAPLPDPVPAPPDRAQAPAPAAVPPGVTPAQWAALQAELAARPGELQRLSDHLHFNDRVQRLRQAPPGDARHALAREIDAGLDARLAAGELSAGEARLLKMAVLRELLPDEAARQAALSQWETALAARPPDPFTRAAHARDAEFQRRQQAVVDAWRAQPAAQRDPKQLERQLDALRAETYASTDPPRRNP